MDFGFTETPNSWFCKTLVIGLQIFSSFLQVSTILLLGSQNLYQVFTNQPILHHKCAIVFSNFCTPSYKSKGPQQLALIPYNITYQGTKGVLFLQFYLLSQKILKAFINYLQSYLLDQNISIAFGQILYNPTYWIKKPSTVFINSLHP